MNKNLYILIFILIFLLLILAGYSIVISKKYFVLKELFKAYNVKSSIVYSEKIDNKKAQTKNILFIGNSITYHPIASYWFTSCGMAASSKNNDFVHLLVKKFENDYNVNYTVAGVSEWERLAHDRDEFLPMIDDVMKIKNDYIVVQLGENATDFSTLKNDFVSLINYIKKKNPSAKIVVVGNFKFNNDIEHKKCKVDACKKTNVPYIDVSDIDNDEYYLGAGKKILGDDNKYHLIDHAGVMVHPNDKAMKVYADRIYEAFMKY